MSDRHALAEEFLQSTPWSAARRDPLSGDASNRSYQRLVDGTRHAVLMNAPPERGEDTRPFVHIATHLSAIGLSAPRILAQDTTNGFLLLEDLGDDLFARVVAADPTKETPLYEAATDVLVHLHRADLLPGLVPYSPQVMVDMAALAYDWYLAGATGRDADAKATFTAAFRPLLEQHAADQSVLIQRDYHAENLLWLPGRDGVARVGLLDFQDAMAGHPAYDLVSLLQDARRDVSPATEQHMIAHFIRQTGHDEPAFRAAYSLLGAQRNLRILGVFARLCIRDGKPGYIDLIPRVWALLMRDLEHPALAPVAGLIAAALPAPSTEILQRLKSQCVTRQLP